MQEIHLRNRRARQRLHRTNRHPLHHPRDQQRREIRAQRTPCRCQYEEDYTGEIDGAFPVEDCGGPREDTANAEAEHEQACGEGDAAHGDVVVGCDIGEACGQEGGHAAADGAVDAEAEEGGVAAPAGPVEGVVWGGIGLRGEDDGAVGGGFGREGCKGG